MLDLGPVCDPIHFKNTARGGWLRWIYTQTSLVGHFSDIQGLRLQLISGYVMAQPSLPKTLLSGHRKFQFINNPPDHTEEDLEH
jgi:hypothetical protein